MLRSFAAQDDGTLRPIEGAGGAIWLDLVSPDPDELEAVSRDVGVSLPSREAQEEIEHSSRLYIDGGVPLMTILLPTSPNRPGPGSTRSRATSSARRRCAPRIIARLCARSGGPTGG